MKPAETLEISRANVLNIHNKGNREVKDRLELLFGKETFNRDITELCGSIQDVIDLTNPDKEVLELINYKGSNRKIIGAQNFVLGELIADVLNEGETPDVTKQGVEIWFPVFERGGFGFSDSYYVIWSTSASAGARLGFKDKKSADHAGRTFPQVYKELIIK